MNIFAFFSKFVGHFSNCCSLNVKTSMSRKKHPYVKSGKKKKKKRVLAIQTRPEYEVMHLMEYEQQKYSE